MRISRAGLKRWWPKICSSAWKVTVVPRRFGAAPTFSTGPSGMPREKLCWNSSLLRATCTTMLSESALTTEAPTPCNPPEVW